MAVPKNHKILLPMEHLVKLTTPEVVCKAKPTPEDEASNAVLETFVESYASAGPPTAQLDAIKVLYELFGEWVTSLGAEFHMFLSGSYKMNVHTKDADIDAVFVTTSQVNRTQVFKGFVDKLEACELVTDLTPIPNARVPIICITLKGQEFDIMTCHLRLPTLPKRESMLENYMWMNGLDEASILAFNGPRVTEVILSAVPRKRHFLLAVRFMRLWAKQRCIYSNKSGYLGGINIVLMVAYIAIRNPKAVASTLIAKTFSTFAKWDWVSHKQVAFVQEHPCPVWLRVYDMKVDNKDAMVMLTPCYPRFNTMHAASEYSCRVMTLEFARGADILAANSQSFQELCVPLPLGSMCKRFLKISVTVPTQGGVSWHGYIESQVRYLLQYLSKEELAIAMFRFIPHWVTSTSDENSSTREAYVTADDDRRIRTYAVKGNIHRAFDYFMETHACAGPKQPKGSVMSIAFVHTADVPIEKLVGGLLPFESAAPPVVQEEIVEEAVVLPKPTVPRPQVVRVFPAPQPHRIVSTTRTKIKLGSAFVPRPRKRTTVVHIRQMDGKMVQPYDVYIGPSWAPLKLRESPTLLHAPVISAYETREAWLDAYRQYAEARMKKEPSFRRLVKSMHGKTLACWCAPQPCHGSVLARLAAE